MVAIPNPQLGDNAESSIPKIEIKPLPVDEKRIQFIETIRKNNVVIVSGEPGSGKSTRPPQWLCQEFQDKGKKIACCQLRRLSAKALATRVAQEVGTKVGGRVGYRVRLDSKLSASTSIVYMTYGILIQDLKAQRTLDSYSVVMLDDVHERSVGVDLLVGFLKIALGKRPDLKVVIASATGDCQKFATYFSGAPIMRIPGSTPFPVTEEYWEPVSNKDYEYVEACGQKVLEIHRSGRKGDILVFLSGEEEIESCLDYLNEQDPLEELCVLPCYSILPLADLKKVLKPVPEGYKRKVVVASNIAETSLTIEGITFVIDSGMVRRPVFDYQTRITTFQPCDITKDEAKQRAGRVGRTGPGSVIRVFSERVFKGMRKHVVPEVLRSNLEWTVMTLASFEIDDFSGFPFMESPKPDLIQAAVESLKFLGLLDSNQKLTDRGNDTVALPLEPRLAVVLLKSVELGCVDEVLTIAAIMSAHSSGEGLFGRRRRIRRQVNAVKRTYQRPEGELFTGLNVYNAGRSDGHSREWCWKNFINPSSLNEVHLIRNQLQSVLNSYVLKVTGKEYFVPPFGPAYVKVEGVQKCILAAYLDQIAQKVEGKASYVRLRTAGKKKAAAVQLTSYSHLAGLLPELVVYGSLVKGPNGKTCMRNVTAINPAWVPRDLFPQA